jgi:hypothetical protein
MHTHALAAATVALAVILVASLLLVLLAAAFDDPRIIATLITVPFRVLGRGDGTGHANAADRYRSLTSPHPWSAGTPTASQPASREPSWLPTRPEQW